MYGRLTRLQAAPESLEKGIAHFKETIAPNVRSQPGNAGAVLLVDRKTGAALGITLWETSEALNASEQLGMDSRTSTAQTVSGSIVNVTRFEQVIADRQKPPAAGTYVRVSTVPGNPANLESATSYMREKVLPVLHGQRGYRGCVVNVDRTTGVIGVSTIWDSMSDLEASEGNVRDLRRTAAEIAGATTDARVEIFETAFAELRLPTTV